MRSGWGWSAALAAAAAYLLCAGPAGAGTDDDATVILFSGRDLWRNGAFAYGGFLTAPGGFDDDGLMLKVLLSGGLYRYRAGDLGGEQVAGFEGTTQVLPGFRIKRQRRVGDLRIAAQVAHRRSGRDRGFRNPGMHPVRDATQKHVRLGENVRHGLGV